MKVFFALAFFAAAAVFGFRHLERRLIFYPMKSVVSTPKDIGLSYEDITFETADSKKLHGWFIRRDGATCTVLFFHGNAGNIGHRLDKIRILHDLGAQIFIFDYRGYGRSGGTPAEKGMHADTRAAYRHLTEELRIPGGEVVAYGESIGGAFAVRLGATEKLGAVITENAFTSIPDMARRAFGFPVGFLLATKLDSISRIQNVRCPKLIIHAEDDEIVPFSYGVALYEKAVPPKQFLKIRGTHNGAFLESLPAYKQGLSDFLESLTRTN